jgi:hypothetical protein
MYINVYKPDGKPFFYVEKLCTELSLYHKPQKNSWVLWNSLLCTSTKLLIKSFSARIIKLSLVSSFLLGSIFLRREAVYRVESLPQATEEQLSSLSDVCPICFSSMSQAKVTPWLMNQLLGKMSAHYLKLLPKARNLSWSTDKWNMSYTMEISTKM